MPERFTQICSWCNKTIYHGDKNSPISHGLCEDCLIFLEHEITPIKTLLDKIQVPVLLVDKKGIVQTANKIGLENLQKPLKDVEQHLGGVVMNCIFSELPEGCGNTEHCSGCTIRNSVMETFKSGSKINNRIAYQYIRMKDGVKKMQITISTKKIGDNVLLFIEDMKPSSD